MPTGESAATAYGRSKLIAEHYLLNLADPLDVVILRPTAVYGPREKDFLLAIKAMKHHLCLAFGRKQQRLSFIYVKDLCKVATPLLKGRDIAPTSFQTVRPIPTERSPRAYSKLWVHATPYA